MKTLKRALSLLLVLCMVFGLAVSAGAARPKDGRNSTDTMAPIETGSSTGTSTPSDNIVPRTTASGSDGFYKIVHLDCGRKYFTVSWVKRLIDEMAKDGYTHLELAFGNDGLRFLLNDMSVTVGDTTYSSEDVKAGIQAGNVAYYDAGTNEWSESDMNAIIDYATSKNIAIIPLLNTPGHMDAILDAMEHVGISNPAFTAGNYGTSGRTVDLENKTAVAFTQALVQKYITYFYNKGCKFFNLGTDEYANDILINYSGMGFGYLQEQNKYGLFVDYVNDLASAVIAKGMTPMAFNDGIYYGSDIDSGTFNSNIMITYWSNGWGNYSPASAEFLANQGLKLINTHGDFYYVLGKDDNFDSGSSYADNWDNAKFQGTTFTEEQAGAMFCIWCDVPSAETEAQITTKVIDTGILSALSEKMGHTATVAENTVSCEGNSVSVTAPGLTQLNCYKVLNPAYSAEGATVVGYNITPYVGDAAYTGSGTVTISVPTELAGFSSIRVYDARDNVFVDSSLADGVITFTASHFSEYDIVAQNETEYRTINVTVGGTATDVIDGDFSGTYPTDNQNIATVSAEYGQVSGAKETKEVTSITSDKQYLILNTRANKLLTDETYSGGLYLNGSLSADSTELWTITSSGNGYTVKNSSGRYLTIGNSSASVNQSSATLSLNYSNGTWTIAQSVTSSRKTTTYYLNDYGGTGTYAAGYSSVDAGSQWKIYEVVDSAPVNATTVTFTGVAAGTTYVTVGNVRYTINVIAEDLSKVTPLTVEYWITNRQVTANNVTSGTIAATASGVYSESGALFSSLVPAAGTAEGNDVVFWKGTRLDSSHQQTTASGVDRTKSGTDFTYIRYWENSWAYSADGVTWTNVASGDQIVAYYLQVTEVTNEVTTQVVDWGPQKSSWSELSYLGTKYVLVDYTVKYESGDEYPSTFPTANSLAFHCDTSTTKNGYYYRTIGMTRAEETSDYEVYMITVTPTSNNPGTTLASTASNNNSYSYNGTEVVAWAATQEDLDNSGLGTYTSISGAFTYSIGGDPIVSGLEIYRQQGMKVTYYVRAKVTEDSLTVHYIDQTVNQEFYNYGIVVASGTTFDADIALADSWKGPLANGTVTNSLGKSQTVSADLSTMPAIGAQYRYSQYTCVSVVRSDDGKDVYLYYTFDNTNSFVVDFGLPLEITRANLGLENTSTLTASNVSGAKYGNAVITEGKIVYTPTQTLEGIETLLLTLTDDTGTYTRTIYIYPATTVYYEEGFADYTGAWTGTTTVNYTATQATQVAGESTDEYGYDAAYASTVGASNGTQATSSAKGDKAEFSFTGTGVDIYANSTTNTGTLVIQVKKVQGSTVKLIQVLTVMADGTLSATDGQEVTGYNIPVASITGLEHGDYSITITHSDANTVNLDGFRVYGTLRNQSNTVYTNDQEDNPTFIEMRDEVLTALKVDPDKSQYASQIAGQVYSPSNITTEGAVIISANEELSTDDILDLLDNGPKNEIYLHNGQSLVFNITTNREVQIGLKALDANTSYTISVDTAKVADNKALNSSTDMFYTVLNRATTESARTITITNNGTGILSITKLKVCDDPNAALGTLTESDLTQALIAMGYAADEQTTEPTDPTTPTDPTDPTEPTVPSTPSTPSTSTGTAAGTEPELPFTDVSDSASYYDAVQYVYDHELMNGTSTEKFSPAATLDRAMVVTILYRLEGKPEVSYTGKFADVADGIWYTEGVEWAAANGIVTGYTNGNYGPLDPVTREQLAAILYRYAQYKGYDVAVKEEEIPSYADAQTVSAYAVSAVQWAAANELLLLEAGNLRPRASATRAEVAIAVAAFHALYIQ